MVPVDCQRILMALAVHVRQTQLDIGVLLGVKADPGYRATDVPLTPSMLFALYTDGLTGPGNEWAQQGVLLTHLVTGAASVLRAIFPVPRPY